MLDLDPELHSLAEQVIGASSGCPYLKATGYQLGLIINFHVEVFHDGVVRIIQSESS